ncbi:hypothetical protein [Chryseobacterium shigense]|uniref:Omptin family protein n=1 Tax=Chryseobacterium shigense TaxID=297244 RepID=A0A841MX37_9FLAO|nr:hypothetical protein [Chryseobacterium shigense]MBB6369104.1 hypothetical protein [Chryseobacterium shigense]
MNNLKIFLISIFCLLMHSHMSGQAFKLEELAAFNKLDMATFKTEIRKHKYTFYDRTESPDFILFEYDSPDYVYKIGKFEYTGENSENHIEFQFKDKKDYNFYVKAVLAAGYKQTTTGKIITDEGYTDYFKNKSHIRIVEPENAEDSYTILVFR